MNPLPRILIVDDNEDDIFLTKKILNPFSKNNYLIESVSSGESCLKKIGESNYDLILLDYSLPVMDGLCVLKKIRMIDSEIPVIMVTGRGDEKTPVEALNCGANHFIIKSNDYLQSLPHIINEVIEKRVLLQNLRKSEKKYKNLVERIPDIIYELDSKGVIKYLSHEATRALGYVQEQLIGIPFSELVYEKDIPLLHEHLAKEKKGEGVIRALHLRLIKKNGEISHFEINSNGVYGNNGEFMASEGIARDITERIRLGNELMQSEKLAALGGLISGVAHELNNPLTGILFYSEGLLNTDSLDVSYREDLSKINREANRCARIVKDLLVFSRSHKLNKVPILINQVVEEALDNLEFQISFDDITVEKIFDENMPPASGDPHQLRQAFNNIINNAIQAMASTGGKRRLRIRTKQLEGNISITINDNGPGIADENIKKIFEPFFSTKEVGKGTGLGLSLSYGIVKDHNGTIEVKNLKQGGASFNILLPIMEKKQNKNKSVTGETNLKINPKQILLVDNEQDVRLAIGKNLSKDGHKIDTASSGKDAIDLIKDKRHDLYIIDVNLPDMCSFELVDLILNSYFGVNKKIVITAGEISEEAEMYAINMKCRYLRKPFGLKEVEEILKDIYTQDQEGNFNTGWSRIPT